jgi:hypothetical protein
VRAALGALLLAFVSACGDGNGSPSPSPNPTPQDPCASVREEEFQAPGAGLSTIKARPLDGSPRWRVLDALWTHREARERRLTPTAANQQAATASDIGDIAILLDQGDLILPANTYDLKATGIRFTRSGSGGYDVRQADGTFRTTLGTRLTLTDDATTQRDVPFSFPFYSGSHRTAFVNSDGNITFGEGDAASTDRNVARLLTGPPRVASFLADLDPSAGGGIFLNATADQYTVTWCNVRGFDSSQTTTVQATLLPDGAIEMKFGSNITLGNAIVGLSPGRTGIFAPVDLSAAGPTAGDSGAVGERFSDSAQLDTLAVTRAFYRSHPDSYDQIVMWTDTPIVQDAFAFESTVANEIRGVGLEIFDFARDFGSEGRLRSFVVMDALTKYPDDPLQRFLGENNTVSLLGQESGHRWLAFLEFRDHTGQRSDALLGRDLAHWSYFMDSDASVMEGNDIEDLGGGAFRTIGAVRRYSQLDQYAMGLVGPGDVPTFFYVENPVNLSKPKERASAPEVGVTFNGTRRDVLIDDVIAVLGPRQPSAAESPRVHSQAFVYIVGAGRSVDAGQVAKVDRIRRQWEAFFLAATEGRMRADTRLGQ